jgi:hypothetical protein
MPGATRIRKPWRWREHLLVVAALLVAADLSATSGETQGSPDTGAPRAYVIHVGPHEAITTIAEAARRARDGDTIEIEAGNYIRDVAIWNRSDLTIRGVGGPVRIIAAGASAEGKATWVVRGDRIVVENVTFIGSRVRDRNGAGIRLERGQLKVIDCAFLDNQNGILTANRADIELEIENSEFGNNGAGDGQSHNLYAGAIAKLSVIGSYFHHANVGHLLKSRALRSDILYNRLTDETGGRASYELEFPSGGLARVIGNVIEQGALTDNSTIISYGAEGYRWPRNELYLVNNTIIDDRPDGGTFLRVKAGADRIKAVNNLLFGKGNLDSAGRGEYRANYHAQAGDFASPPEFDYRLKRRSKLIGKAEDPGSAEGVNLRPTREYIHPRQSRPVAPLPYNPGAIQSLAR